MGAQAVDCPSLAVKGDGLAYKVPAAFDGPGLVKVHRHPAAQPFQEVLGGKFGVEVATEAVEGGEHRRQHLVQGTCQSRAEIVLLVDGGQCRPDRPGDAQAIDQAPPPCAVACLAGAEVTSETSP
jgi:hypothetical protein